MIIDGQLSNQTHSSYIGRAIQGHIYASTSASCVDRSADDAVSSTEAFYQASKHIFSIKSIFLYILTHDFCTALSRAPFCLHHPWLGHGSYHWPVLAHGIGMMMKTVVREIRSIGLASRIKDGFWKNSCLNIFFSSVVWVLWGGGLS